MGLGQIKRPVLNVLGLRCQHPAEIWLYDSGALVQAGVVGMSMLFEAIRLDEITREWGDGGEKSSEN